jgi:hypothetical protein
VLVNDATLQLLVEMRPATLQDLSSVSGFGAAALQHFGQPLLQVGGPGGRVSKRWCLSNCLAAFVEPSVLDMPRTVACIDSLLQLPAVG